METIFEVCSYRAGHSEDAEENNIVRSPGPGHGLKLAAHIIGREDREILFVMCLSTKNRIVAVHRCHVGSLNSSVVHPREVFKTSILNNAASIIVAHPSKR